MDPENDVNGNGPSEMEHVQESVRRCGRVHLVRYIVEVLQEQAVREVVQQGETGVFRHKVTSSPILDERAPLSKCSSLSPWLIDSLADELVQ